MQATPFTETITYNITSDHATGGLGTAPFGTVELDQNGTDATAIVTLATGYKFVLTGAADFQDFKFNATGVALTDITVTQNDLPQFTLVADAGAFNGDGTGNFGFGITGTGQGNGLAHALNTTIIQFTVANATIADLTAPNNLGIIFVADLYSSSTGNTGPADVTPGSTVPEPSVLFLLGAGLIGLGGLRRRFKKWSTLSL